MGLFRFLFLEKKCLAHSAFGLEQYADAASRLHAQGVSYDVVRKSDVQLNGVFGGAEASFSPSARAAGNNVQYDFYVRKEDEQLVQKALRANFKGHSHRRD